MSTFKAMTTRLYSYYIESMKNPNTVGVIQSIGGGCGQLKIKLESI